MARGNVSALRSTIFDILFILKLLEIIAEELKRVGVAGPVAVLKRVKTSPEKTSVLKFAVNSIHNGTSIRLYMLFLPYYTI
jgi:hypothetical protein